MKDEKYIPTGIKFYDQNGRRMCLVTEGSYEGWIAREQKDGNWITYCDPSEELATKIIHAWIKSRRESDRILVDVFDTFNGEAK